MDEFPSITDLFEFLNDDSTWDEIGKSYLFIGEIIGKCIAELFKRTKINKIDAKRDIDDYRFYAGRYLLRSVRIYRSIILLSIYDSCFEAEMLQRPLLENIAETKYFLNSRRARAIKKIKLYELINSKREYESTYAKDFSKFTDKYGNIISTKYIFESGETLRKDIENRLLNYSDAEIIKMEEIIKKNLSWHGKHRNQLFKEKYVNMESKIEVYGRACAVLHIREERPFLFEKHTDFYPKAQSLDSSLLMVEHIKDFIKLCPETFASSDLNNNLGNIERNLQKRIYDEVKEHDPRVFEFVTLIPIKE